jgi:hypothetical protein
VIFVGVDWAEAHNDVALMDEDGRLLGRGRFGVGWPAWPPSTPWWSITPTIRARWWSASSSTTACWSIRWWGPAMRSTASTRCR